MKCILMMFLYSSTDELSIHFNRLEGQIPSEIGLLTKLSTYWRFWMMFVSYLLQTYADALTLSPAALLSLWGNNLTGRIPPEIGNLTNLSELLVCLLDFRILAFLLISSQTVLQIHYGCSTTEI